MNSLIQRPCGSSVRASSRGCAVRGCVAPLIAAPRRQAAPCNAVRQEIEPVSFGDVYLAMQERVATSGTLPKVDGRIMVESIRSLEHGQRVLELIARHVVAKREMAGALELDWPVRKKWLARVCQLALRIPNSKQLILDIFANAEAFALSTYFAAEMVDDLAASGAEAALLTRLVELFRSKRKPGDKGVASAYHRLLAVMRDRKDEAAARTASVALRSYIAPVVPVPRPSPAPVVEEAAVGAVAAAPVAAEAAPEAAPVSIA